MSGEGIMLFSLGHVRGRDNAFLTRSVLGLLCNPAESTRKVLSLPSKASCGRYSKSIISSLQSVLRTLLEKHYLFPPKRPADAARKALSLPSRASCGRCGIFEVFGLLCYLFLLWIIPITARMIERSTKELAVMGTDIFG